jgi:hypothetical protein
MTINQQYKEFLRMKPQWAQSKDWTAKGTAGENLAYSVLRKYQRRYGGEILRSYTFKYARKPSGVEYPGNLVFKGGKLISIQIDDKKSKRSLIDEIDLLYVTSYCVIPIEVKAYGSKIVLRDDWWDYTGDASNKYPLLQAEKHCRHLYHNIYDILPGGDPGFIKPIVVFVDRTKITDERSAEFVKSLRVANLNSLYRVLIEVNHPKKVKVHYDQIMARLHAIHKPNERGSD